MSQENVEIVARHFEAIVSELAGYDWDNPRSIVAAMEGDELEPRQREVFERLHPETRWTTAFGTIYEGRLGVARGIDEMLEASRTYSVRILEVSDLGGDRVLVVAQSAMEGQSSGATGSVSVFTVLTMKDGLIARSEEYLSRADALRAAGLED
jgi:ketosteroid isomerase-like protein